MEHRVAILPWGNTIEHYLDPIGVDLNTFATGMSGGWLFGYADALRHEGVGTVVVCTSRAVTRPTRIEHPETGVITVVLPVPGAFRATAMLVGDGDVRPARGYRALAQELAGRLSLERKALTATFKREGCTAVLCQEYEHPRLATALLAARSAGVRCFATFQGGTKSPSAVVTRLRAAAMLRADGLVIASGEEVERVRTVYGFPESRVLPAPNPISLETWYPEDRRKAREQLGIPGQAFLVVCHGRIEWQRKGIDVLLDAWRLLVSWEPTLQLNLRLIGSGADDARLESELESDPVPGLTWVRGYSNDRSVMRTELSAADAYVLPSRHEGFAVAPLEAMACGLPVVLTDAPGTADILARGIQSGGLRVPRGDPVALAGALQRLARDGHLRARMASDALDRVRNYASVPTVGRQLARFLRVEEGVGQT